MRHPMGSSLVISKVFATYDLTEFQRYTKVSYKSYSCLLFASSRFHYSMGAVLQLGHLGNRSVYMDANATTQLLPEVFDAMVPWLFNRCGNASSGHKHGREACATVEAGRQQVAGLIHYSRQEVVFTNEGTEANNLAIFGTVTKPGAHIVTSSSEHNAVIHAVKS